MFNHYTPQSDGSYQRSTRPDPIRPTRQPMTPPPQSTQSRPAPSPQPGPPPPSAGGFWQNLRPRQMDAADLLVVFLVLLMGREEDRPAPLLTLALYFLL